MKNLVLLIICILFIGCTKHDPQEVQAVIQKVCNLESKGKYNECCSLATELIDVQGIKHHNLYYNRGLSRYALGMRKIDVIEDFDQMVKTTPDSLKWAAYAMRANLKKIYDDPVGMQEDSDKAVELRSDKAETIYRIIIGDKQ